MSLNSCRIEPLPPEVIAKLKSSTSITNLNGVVVELVKNALDAKAHTINVTIDFRRGGCKVDDDGDGILPSDFEPSGGLGKAHHTSKLRSVSDVYGRKGLFLASLSSLSLLTITSHHVHHPNTNTIMFHHSTPVARLIPAPVQQELGFRDHGTSVTVNDLFGNMPVRVKSRALALQKFEELDRQWDELRQLLVSLMIANDNLIKLMITDTATDRKLIIRPQTRRRRTDDGLDLQRIGSILAQAALIDYQNADSWDVAYASVPDFAIHAAISLVPSPTKKVQFVSVGMDPIFPRSSVNLFYSEVNRLFSLSDFGTMGAPSVAALDASSGEHLDHQSSTNTKPMTKSVNKWPMFYIRIDTNEPYKVNGESQGVPESDKSVQRILDVLTAMVFEFLRQHKLRPRARKRRQKMPRNVTIGENTSNASSALSHLEEASSTEEALGGRLKLPNFQKSAPRTCQSFGEWSKIKVAKESFNAHSRKPETKLLGLENASGIEQPLAQDNQPAKRRTPVESRWSLANNGSTDNYDDPERDPMVPWTDPYTGRSHLVNSRTGQSIDVRSPMDAFRRSKSTGSLQSIRTSDSATRSRSTILSRTQNLWVEKLLGSWENPAFSRTEKPVNVIGARCDIGTDTMHARVHDGSAELCGFDNLGLSKFRGKLRKQDLEAAEVVAQVDQKFILAKLKFTAMNCHSSDPNSTLVLIDQHAGDERCRVERLLEEFFTPPVGGPRQVQTVTLEPLIFEIPVTEASLFGRYTKFFKFWGVDYTVEQEPANTTTHISVNKLPTLIAERCRLEPELVTNLIRGEIWKREENGRGSRPSFLGLEGGAGRWADRLDSCPQGIIELLNSRACRTSIMFNDKLTIDECQSLVRQLARCVFPFQCAHGRPSMIPILDMTQNVALVQLEAEYTREEGEHLEFTEAFRAWRDRIAFH